MRAEPLSLREFTSANSALTSIVGTWPISVPIRTLYLEAPSGSESTLVVHARVHCAYRVSSGEPPEAFPESREETVPWGERACVE